MGKYIHKPKLKFDNDEEEKIFLKVMKENMDQYSIDGATGAVQKLIGDILNGMLGEELTEHLGYEKSERTEEEKTNSRNGYSEKTIGTTMGKAEINVPRDRNGEFKPQVVKKGEKRLSEEIEYKILSMYARGTSTRDISEQVEEIYGIEVSATMVSNITGRVKEALESFKSRKLEEVYPIVYMDAIRYKVKSEGKTIEKSINLAMGIPLDGKKDILGFWLCENESASYWLNILNELKNRGVKQILIASVDGLKGFPEAIKSAYPGTEVQRCIVHQIRFSLKLVSYKDRKEVTADLKNIYKAPIKKSAEKNLEDFSEKWDEKYPFISKSWKNNWEELSTYFKYPEEIRRLIYTTNPIESLNSQLRKVTNNKGVFNSDESLEKMIYMKIEKVLEKWGRVPIPNWSSILSQLMIYFEDKNIDWKKLVS